jgi:hypothetical protein
MYEPEKSPRRTIVPFAVGVRRSSQLISPVSSHSSSARRGAIYNRTLTLARAHMMFRYFSRLLGALLIVLFAMSSQAQSQSRQDFSCSLGSMKRIVSIVTFAPSDQQPRGACRVDYTKEGVTKEVFSSATGHAYCTKQATALVTKLGEAHYSCSLQTLEESAK